MNDKVKILTITGYRDKGIEKEMYLAIFYNYGKWTVSNKVYESPEQAREDLKQYNVSKILMVKFNMPEEMQWD